MHTNVLARHQGRFPRSLAEVDLPMGRAFIGQADVALVGYDIELSVAQLLQQVPGKWFAGTD